MIEFKKYPFTDTQGQAKKLTIASGPVIIQDDKVLLDKHGEDPFWKFPGGKLQDTNSIQENAKREVHEELQIEVEFRGDPYIIGLEKKDEWIILIHYLAHITQGIPTPGRDVREWKWHPIDALPKDCAPNIIPVLEHFKTS